MQILEQGNTVPAPVRTTAGDWNETSNEIATLSIDEGIVNGTLITTILKTLLANNVAKVARRWRLTRIRFTSTKV